MSELLVALLTESHRCRNVVITSESSVSLLSQVNYLIGSVIIREISVSLLQVTSLIATLRRKQEKNLKI